MKHEFGFAGFIMLLLFMSWGICADAQSFNLPVDGGPREEGRPYTLRVNSKTGSYVQGTLPNSMKVTKSPTYERYETRNYFLKVDKDQDSVKQVIEIKGEDFGDRQKYFSGTVTHLKNSWGYASHTMCSSKRSQKIYGTSNEGWCYTVTEELCDKLGTSSETPLPDKIAACESFARDISQIKAVFDSEGYKQAVEADVETLNRGVDEATGATRRISKTDDLSASIRNGGQVFNDALANLKLTELTWLMGACKDLRNAISPPITGPSKAGERAKKTDAVR
jgi:hypothetical protein